MKLSVLNLKDFIISQNSVVDQMVLLVEGTPSWSLKSDGSLAGAVFFIEWLPLGLAVGSVSAGAVGMTQPCVFHLLASLVGPEVRVREGKLLKCQEGTAHRANPSLLLPSLLLLMSHWPCLVGKGKFKGSMSSVHGLMGKLQSHVTRDTALSLGNVHEHFQCSAVVPLGLGIQGVLPPASPAAETC